MCRVNAEGGRGGGPRRRSMWTHVLLVSIVRPWGTDHVERIPIYDTHTHILEVCTHTFIRTYIPEYIYIYIHTYIQLYACTQTSVCFCA